MVDSARLVRRFRQKEKRLHQEILKAAKRGGNRVVKTAKVLVPEGETLDLTESLRVEDRDFPKGYAGVAVLAGNIYTQVTSAAGTFQNAKLQEGGTRNMPANRYFNLAAQINRKGINSAMVRAVKKVWRE